uniref:Hexosyltransferase n=1 Tax=Ciona intestinalis TaxID=7719 RepID=H2XQE9_CIOIN
FVKSSYSGVHKRNMIRNTWASVSYIEGCAFMTTFVMGNPLNDTKAAVKQEMLVHSDILQYDGPDDYSIFSLFRFAASTVAYFVIFTKSTHYFPKKVQTLYNGLTWQEYYENITTIIKGFLPHRSPNSKWFISIDKYKWPSYPNFCLGGMYTTSISVVSQLLETAQSTRPLHLDDVWITGILRLKLGLPDTMLIAPNQSLSVHLGGFSGMNAERSLEVVRRQWAPIFNSLPKETCFC